MTIKQIHLNRNHRMKATFIALSLLFISPVSFARPHYLEAQTILEKAPENIRIVMKRAPNIYEFSSRFDGRSNVSFTGQTFRQILINNLEFFMSSLKRKEGKRGGYPGSVTDAVVAMNSYFKFRSNGPLKSHGSINGLSRHHLQFKDLNGTVREVSEGSIYNAIQLPAKNLVSKIAGNDNLLRNRELKGWGSTHFYGLNLLDINADKQNDLFVEPEDFIQAIFQTVAKNAFTGVPFTVPNGALEVQSIDNANITEDGVDLAQIVHKFLQGSVAFSQASGDYLSTDMGPGKGLNGDNTKPYKSSKNYTALEHFWDEAFGYFGAARDFATYTDMEIAEKLSKDSNGDGKISVLREKNIGEVAQNSAQMDLQVEHDGEGGLDLSGEAIMSFIAGRELISKKPAGYLKYVQAHAAIAIGVWEKTLAATVIHYINSTLEVMDGYGTTKYFLTTHAKSWSGMKGYALAFQFNPTSQLSLSDFETFHNLVGDKPTLMTASMTDINDYKENLLKARDILRKAFGFSRVNTEAF